MKVSSREIELASSLCALQSQYNRLIIERDSLQNMIIAKLSEIGEMDKLLRFQSTEIEKLKAKKK